jgi:hypothetical protein
MVKLYGHMFGHNPLQAKVATLVAFESEPDKFYTDASEITKKVSDITLQKTGFFTPSLYLRYMLLHRLTCMQGEGE